MHQFETVCKKILFAFVRIAILSLSFCVLLLVLRVVTAMTSDHGKFKYGPGTYAEEETWVCDEMDMWFTVQTEHYGDHTVTHRCWGELELNGEIISITYDMGSGLEDMVLIQRAVEQVNDTICLETLYSGSGRFHKDWFMMHLYQDFFGDGTRTLKFRLQ